MQSTFTVGPNREAVSDLIISIPNDSALLGRRFEADILSRTISQRGVYAVALLSRLLIHVDSTAPSEDELKKKYVDENVANLDFTVIPINAPCRGKVMTVTPPSRATLAFAPARSAILRAHSISVLGFGP